MRIPLGPRIEPPAWLGRTWVQVLLGALIVACVATGTGVALWYAREGLRDQGYAQGYDEGRRGMTLVGCYWVYERKLPRQFAPHLDLDAWLEGCRKAVLDGADAPPPDPTVGPPGSAGVGVGDHSVDSWQ